MNNTPYGKTIENVGKRTDIRLLNEETKAYRLTEKPHCIDFKIFTENMFGVELRKVNQLINKPFQIGFYILEWSKLYMYRAYAALKDWYGPAIRLLYTDTDSLIIHVKSHDLYKDILDVPVLRELKDLSELPVNHPSGVGDLNFQNKGILRKFKVVCHVIFDSPEASQRNQGVSESRLNKVSKQLLEVLEEPDLAITYLGALAAVTQDREETISE